MGQGQAVCGVMRLVPPQEVHGLAGDGSTAAPRPPRSPWTVALKLDEDKELAPHGAEDRRQGPSSCTPMDICRRETLSGDPWVCFPRGDDEVLPQGDAGSVVVVPVEAVDDVVAVAGSTDGYPIPAPQQELEASLELTIELPSIAEIASADGSMVLDESTDLQQQLPSRSSKEAARQAAEMLLHPRGFDGLTVEADSTGAGEPREPQRKGSTSRRKDTRPLSSLGNGLLSPAAQGLQAFLDTSTAASSVGSRLDIPSSPFNTLDYEEMTRHERHDARALLKDFVKTMVRGRHLSVIDGDGKTRHCFCSLNRKLDKLKISLNRNDEKSREFLLSCIEDILLGSTARSVLDESQDEQLVTLKLDTRDLITFLFPDLESRDKFVMCLKMFSIQTARER